MRLWIFIVTVLVLTPLSAAETGRPDDPRPNIVLIMADDVGYECFGCYGSEQYETPHIDRLARGGMRWTHCYSQPLCTPSRIKLMTGLSNVRNYSAFSVLNRDQPWKLHGDAKAAHQKLTGAFGSMPAEGQTLLSFGHSSD